MQISRLSLWRLAHRDRFCVCVCLPKSVAEMFALSARVRLLMNSVYNTQKKTIQQTHSRDLCVCVCVLITPNARACAVVSVLINAR